MDSSKYRAPEEFLELSLAEAMVYEIHYSSVAKDWNALWKLFLNFKVSKIPVWRTFWERFEDSLEDDSVPIDYKEICVIINGKCQDLETNWRTGNFKLSKFRLKGPLALFSMDEDYVLNVPEAKNLDFNFQLLERSTLAEQWRGYLLGRDEEVWDIHHAVIQRSILVFCGDGMMRVINVDNQQEVNQVNEPRGRPVDHLCIGSDGYMAAISADLKKKKARELNLWKMKAPNDITFIRQWTFEGDIFGLHVDDRLITVLVIPTDQAKIKGAQLHFISIESLSVERTLSLPLRDTSDVTYGDGLLVFVQLAGSMRIMDASSGRFISQIECKPWRDISDIKINSKFIITAENFVNGSTTEFRLYDRKLVAGQVSTTPFDAFVTSFQVPNFRLNKMLLSETRLVCYGNVQKKPQGVEDSMAIVQLDFAGDLLNFGQDFFSTMKSAFRKLRKIIPAKCKEFSLED